MGGGEMSSKELLEKEAERRRGALLLVLEQLRRHGSFTLSAPVALLTGDAVETVPVSALANRVPCSSAFSHHLMQQFRELEGQVGFDTAFERMASDDPEGEEFCRVWDECCEQQGRVKWTTDDVVEVIAAVRKETESESPGLVVVWDRPGESVLWGVLKMG
jgi:hypothetical protein